MMKKIFGMAAVSALAFSMFACSGEDGADGINGKDGADGADGIGCVVKSLKDGSGYKVLCDGDSVGVLKNGADGKDGTKGADGEDGEDGEDGKDGVDGKDAKALTGKNGADGKAGTSCTVKENKAKTGFDIVCGTETVGTVLKGTDGADDEGEDGESCLLKEGENGTVTVTCGEESVTLYKASCGKVGYDPETQFCYNESSPRNEPRIGQRCKYKPGSSVDYFMDRYNPAIYFCDETDTLRPLCDVEKEDGTMEKVPYVNSTQYCDGTQKKVVDRIPCAPNSKVMRKESEYCYTTKGAEGIQLGALLECGSGNGKLLYNPRVNSCLAKSSGTNIASKQGKRLICGDEAAQKDTLNIDIRYSVDLNDDGRGELCDTRDYHIYKTTKIGNTVWMAQNLNYAYDQPTKGYGTGEGIGLKTSSFCFDDDPDNCEIYGRMYLWSAVIDSVNLKDGNGDPWACGDGADCEFNDDLVKGICPDGWHVPKLSDAKQLIIDVDGVIDEYDLDYPPDNDAGLKLRASTWGSGSDTYGFSAIGGGYLDTEDMDYSNKTYYLYLWTDTQADAPNAYALKLSRSNDNASIYNDDKYYAESLRCIKDPE